MPLHVIERNISPEFVARAVNAGEIIAEYPNDQPFPSAILLYVKQKRTLHVVAEIDERNGACYIVTAY